MSGEYLRHRLFGKFFTASTPPTLEEAEQSLRQQWSLSVNDMTVKKLDGDKFLFEFRRYKDKDEVERKGPFYVNGVILVTKDPDCSADTTDFTVTTFAVAVSGLPSYLFNQDYLPTLTSKLGEYNPILVEKPYNPNDVYLFGVKVDLKKPFRPGFYLSQNHFVEFKYFNLGDFCYNCGLIGHIKEDCDQPPEERALNATSTTNVYGPWLRLEPLPTSYNTVLTKSKSVECEKTPSDAQFVIDMEFNCVYASDTRVKSETVTTCRVRFPCSYLDTKTDSTSKACEVIRKEIYENKPHCFSELDDKPEFIGGLVEELRLIQKNEFSCDDKLVTLKLQINHAFKLTPVDYETMLAVTENESCERLIESKISDLIKKRVEENDRNMLFLPWWENKISQVLSEVGLAPFMNFLEVPKRASEAMNEAVHMMISSAHRRA